jgi:hypothetical protein
LRFAEMSRKLETEEEKILPFYSSSLTEQEENDLKQALLDNPGQDLTDVYFYGFLVKFKNVYNFFFERIIAKTHSEKN